MSPALFCPLLLDPFTSFHLHSILPPEELLLLLLLSIPFCNPLPPPVAVVVLAVATANAFGGPSVRPPAVFPSASFYTPPVWVPVDSSRNQGRRHRRSSPLPPPSLHLKRVPLPPFTCAKRTAAGRMERRQAFAQLPHPLCSSFPGFSSLVGGGNGKNVFPTPFSPAKCPEEEFWKTFPEGNVTAFSL